MISVRQARERIRGLAAEEVRALIVRRIMGDDARPVGGGYDDEASEDVVIQLLKADDLDAGTRAAVVAGCAEAFSRLWQWLQQPQTCPRAGLADEVAIRLGTIINVASPPTLQADAYALLEYALRKRGVSTEVRRAAVWAAMGFTPTENDVSQWEKVLRCREFAAYGFDVLLSIDPHAPRIERALGELWQRQVVHDWPIDTPVLMRRTAQQRGSDEVIRRVLSSLRNQSVDADGGAVWDQIATALKRRKWSRPWLLGVHQDESRFANLIRTSANTDTFCSTPFPSSWGVTVYTDPPQGNLRLKDSEIMSLTNACERTSGVVVYRSEPEQTSTPC